MMVVAGAFVRLFVDCLLDGTGSVHRKVLRGYYEKETRAILFE